MKTETKEEVNNDLRKKIRLTGLPAVEVPLTDEKVESIIGQFPIEKQLEAWGLLTNP